MIKFIGITIILSASLLLRAELSRARRRRLLICEELYRFVLHIRHRISCFLAPPSELCEGFESDVLSECGFLESMKFGESPASGFEKSRISNSLNAQEARVLQALFSGIGCGYMEDEIKHIDMKSSEFLELLVSERAATERDVKLIGTLTVTFTLGAVILLM